MAQFDRAALEREAAELEADLLTESYQPEVTGAPMKRSARSSSPRVRAPTSRSMIA